MARRRSSHHITYKKCVTQCLAPLSKQDSAWMCAYTIHYYFMVVNKYTYDSGCGCGATFTGEKVEVMKESMDTMLLCQDYAIRNQDFGA
jgi:hypothetical protein